MIILWNESLTRELKLGKNMNDTTPQLEVLTRFWYKTTNNADKKVACVLMHLVKKEVGTDTESPIKLIIYDLMTSFTSLIDDVRKNIDQPAGSASLSDIYNAFFEIGSLMPEILEGDDLNLFHSLMHHAGEALKPSVQEESE